MRRQRRKGFVLLMALMLIALAALVLTGLARYSLSLAAESEREREEMQLRWGATSVSRAVLHRTDQLFLYNEQLALERGEKVTQLFPLKETVRLGGVDFRVILDDENRKLNVNRVHTRGGLSGLSHDVRMLGEGDGRLRLRPNSLDKRGFAVRGFDSFGQVYAIDGLYRNQNPAEWLVKNTTRVTCWGSGRVHYARCSNEVLEVIALRAAGAVTAGRLVSLREENPEWDLDQLLDGLDASLTKKSRLKSWLTDESKCSSVWIRVEAEERSRYKFAVGEMTSDGTLRTSSFVW